MTAHIVEFESFTQAELESLEFFPEELESIEAELYPNLESISPETVAKDLEAYFEGDVEGVGLEAAYGYQCINTTNKTVYCSKKKLKSHAEGNQWVKGVIAYLKKNGNGNTVTGKPFTSNNVPNGAIQI